MCVYIVPGPNFQETNLWSEWLYEDTPSKVCTVTRLWIVNSDNKTHLLLMHNELLYQFSRGKPFSPSQPILQDKENMTWKEREERLRRFQRYRRKWTEQNMMRPWEKIVLMWQWYASQTRLISNMQYPKVLYIYQVTTQQCFIPWSHPQRLTHIQLTHNIPLLR